MIGVGIPFSVTKKVVCIRFIKVVPCCWVTSRIQSLIAEGSVLTSIWQVLSCISLYLRRTLEQAAVVGEKKQCALPDRRVEGHDPTRFGSKRRRSL